MTDEMYSAPIWDIPIPAFVPVFGIAGGLVMGVAAYWLYGWINSLHPLRTPESRGVARQLASTPKKELAAVIRALTDDQFRAYFNELKPPGLINHPAEAYAYSRVAYRWSRPRFLRPQNEALCVLVEIYDDVQRRLSGGGIRDAVGRTLADDWRQRRSDGSSA